jgi:hypothetical protein
VATCFCVKRLTLSAMLMERAMRRKSLLHSFSAILLLGAVLTPTVGHSEGAIAIGQAPNGDVHTASWRFGDNARSSALAHCRATARKGGYPAGHCRVVGTFRSQCVAYTWGISARNERGAFGWAIRKNLRSAKSAALAKCRASGGVHASTCGARTQGGCD